MQSTTDIDTIEVVPQSEGMYVLKPLQRMGKGTYWIIALPCNETVVFSSVSRLSRSMLVKKHTPLTRTHHITPNRTHAQAREVQAHLSALRSLCRGLLERVRIGPDPLEGAAGAGGDWRQIRAENRLRGLRGRDEVVAREQRCVMCMVNVRLP